MTDPVEEPPGRTLRVLYVSYDGAAEPLGQSQILPCLTRLAPQVDITLISFEKPGADRSPIAAHLASEGIRWFPLDYHKRPPVIGTAVDIGKGSRTLRKLVRRWRPDIIHVRSDVPAAMAHLTSGDHALLYDLRGFWADERLDGGHWRRGVLYWLAKRLERRFYARADAVVTLTESSVPQIQDWLDGRRIPIAVIPTFAEVGRFATREAPAAEPAAVWCGSMSTWYRFDLAPRLAAALDRPLRVLTQEVASARRALDGRPADVRAVSHDEVPSWLNPGDIGLCLYKSTFSRIACAPTRFAEFLAAGMPVAVTPGLGDLERIVERERVGVVVRDDSSSRIRDAAAALTNLAGDPETVERCRRLAHARYHIDVSADRYLSLYRQLAGPS
jgi:glycosyltransferase involved in cell wall biosynthesis